jgi:hypothetical protein
LATARIASAASARSNGRRQLPIGLLLGLGFNVFLRLLDLLGGPRE